MREEAIADLLLRSGSELDSVRSEVRCVRRRRVTTNYKEFSKQRGAIITALLPTGDHQLQRVLKAEGRHHHSSFANREEVSCSYRPTPKPCGSPAAPIVKH